MKTTFTLLRQVCTCILLLSATMVFAEDDLWAGIHCPGDKYVDCDAELWDLSIYGNATYKDYSGQHDAGPPKEKWHLNSCNQGYITRTWEVKIYHKWYSCTQTIYVGGGSSDYPVIDWPEDLEIESCNPNLDPDYLPNGRPTWDYAECQMLGTTYKDQWFYFGGNTCKKLIRKWKVMDWCKHDPVHHPDKGIYEHTQVIKVSQGEEPEVVCMDDITVSTADCDNAYVSVDPLIVTSATCDGQFAISNNSPYADNNGADISGTYPVGTTEVKFTVQYGCGHKKYCTVKITVDNNKAPTPYCHAYLAVALMGIDNDDDGTNDEGMVEIWAKDLNAGSFGNCGNDYLKYSFSEDPNDDVRVFTCADVGSNEVRMYVFDNIGNYNYCTVELSVQNNSAKIQNCEVATTEVDDDGEEEEATGGGDEADDNGSEGKTSSTIDSNLLVAGRVMDIFGNLISGVQVEVSSPDDSLVTITNVDTLVELNVDSIEVAPDQWVVDVTIDTSIITVHDTINTETIKMVTTDGNGEFIFQNIFIVNKDYKVKGYGFTDVPYELAVADIRVLFDHLRNIKVITDPMVLLAADVNQDGSVNSIDIREMIDVITGRKEWFDIKKGSFILRLEDAIADPLGAMSKEDHDYYMVQEIEESFTNADFVMVSLGKLSNPIPEEGRSKMQTRELVNQTFYKDAELMQELSKFFGIVTSELKVSPNPTTGNLQLLISATQSQISNCQLYTINGQLVKEETISLQKGENILRTNMQDLTCGVYFYRMHIDDQVFTKKIIKTE